jgi:hypothetical protein
MFSTYICLFAAFYVGVACYGVVLIARGVRIIIQQRATLTPVSYRLTCAGLETRQRETIILRASNARIRGIFSLMGGLLAAVPWTIPIIRDVPLTWMLCVTPLAGIMIDIIGARILALSQESARDRSLPPFEDRGL